MTIELLFQNISKEISLLQELLKIQEEINNKADKNRKKQIEKSQEVIISQIKIINNAVPDLVNNIAFYKTLGNKSEIDNKLLNVKYSDEKNKPISLAINKKEEKKFLKNLTDHRLSKPVSAKSDQGVYFANLSNRLFRNSANKLVEKGYFDSIKTDLRKITSPFIINSYVSMMLLATVIAAIFGLILGIALFAFGLSFFAAFFALILPPLAIFFLFFLYPSSKRKSLDKNINQELPFVTIYMAAIATSGIEPSKIFNILVASKDYPFIQREMKKLTNLINFYGYDLVSALKEMARLSPSERLAQMLDGLATTITSGGELTEFLNKHSESLLFDYRLEREKYTKTAETFMNIYISVVIAAPMILMMLFILMSLTGFASGISPVMIGLLTVLVIGLLNVGFIVLLNMKQPKF